LIFVLLNYISGHRKRCEKSQTGNSIAHENAERGTDEKPLCEECERLNSSGCSVGNLTNL
jgi:hypothetical protein